MMKRVRRVLSMGIILAVLISCFAACGEGGISEAPGASTEGAQSASQEAPAAGDAGGEKAGDLVLKFFSNEAVMAEKFDLINAEYNSRNPGVTIEVIQVPGADYYTKVDTTILSGEQLDVCYWNIKFDYVPRALKGEFVAMDGFLAAEGKSILDLYTIDATVEDGKVYALPGDVKEWVVWINKDDLDAAGLDVPPLDWTWEDYREYARQLTWGEGAEKHYGSTFYNWDHFNVLVSYNRLDGNPYFKEDGSLNFDDPSFRESLELRYNLEIVDGTQIPLSEILAMELDYRSAFLGGRCSMLVMATNIIPQIAELENYPHDFVTTFAALPIPEGGREGYTYADNRFYCIGSTTADAQATYDYLRYFTTEGIPMKNVTFTADRDAVVSMDEMVDNMTAEHPELFDIDQLKAVLNNPKLTPNFWEYVPDYTSEIVNMFKAEAEKAVMGEISIDDAITNAFPQGETIIKKNS